MKNQAPTAEIKFLKQCFLLFSIFILVLLLLPKESAVFWEAFLAVATEAFIVAAISAFEMILTFP